MHAVMPALRRLMQEDLELEASLDHTVSSKSAKAIHLDPMPGTQPVSSSDRPCYPVTYPVG